MSAQLEARIHNGLLAKLRGCGCTQVQFDGSSGKLVAMDYDLEYPEVSEIGHVRASFVQSDRSESGFSSEMSQWVWNARVLYRSKVDISTLFETLSSSEHNELGPVSDDDPRPITALLENIETIDPPRSNDEVGTVLELTFNLIIPRFR